MLLPLFNRGRWAFGVGGGWLPRKEKLLIKLARITYLTFDWKGVYRSIEESLESLAILTFSSSTSSLSTRGERGYAKFHLGLHKQRVERGFIGKQTNGSSDWDILMAKPSRPHGRRHGVSGQVYTYLLLRLMPVEEKKGSVPPWSIAKNYYGSGSLQIIAENC